ncbi:MAG: hypothetical protein H0U86_12555 [Chloroflexi bacterium]|nr:hypothetical protein [Chloroflexota bacterium]
MEADRVEPVIALLVQAETAHGTFEATELNGAYDEEWPRWYAAYAIEHGIGAVLVREVTTDQLAQLLARSYIEYERTRPKPSEPWAAYAARRIMAEP